MIRLCATLSAVILLIGAPRPIPAAEPDRGPNVVVILADDFGYGDASCYGATLVRTPNIDRLAGAGRRFTDAHAPCSVCSPTRYGLMTGRYCWRTSLKRGVLGVSAPLHIEPTRMTLASLLKRRGYATAAVGKWHLGYGDPPGTDYNKPLVPGPREVGFDYHFGVPSNHGDATRCFVEDDRVVGREPGEPFVLAAGRGGTPKGLAEPRVDDRVDKVLTEKAVGWLERNKDRPFFLYFTPVAVHNPVTPNEEFRGKSRCGLYGDYIVELDWCVGQVLDALDRNKLADNTLVIFTSDNGGVVTDRETADFALNLDDDADGAVSQHYRMAKAEAEKAGHKTCGDLRGRKHSIYEGGNRVPFVARWPGRVPARTTCEEVVCLTDILATLAAIVGELLPPGAGEDSYDIGPALRGETSSRPIREATVLQNAEGVFAIRQGPWKYVAVGRAPGGPKMSPWAREGATAQLYHLGDDPGETRDVRDRHPDVADRLSKLLNQYRDRGSSRPMP